MDIKFPATPPAPERIAYAECVMGCMYEASDSHSIFIRVRMGMIALSKDYGAVFCDRATFSMSKKFLRLPHGYDIHLIQNLEG